MEPRSEPIGGVPCLVWDTAGAAATVVVCQEIFGVTDYIRSRCADLAAAGHRVVAPEFFHRLADPDGTTPVVTDGPEALTEAMALTGRLDFGDAASDGVAVAQAIGHPVALLGFCWGGGLAFQIAALTPVEALVSYYGSALPELIDQADAVTAPSLHHWGTADAFIGAEAQRPIRDALLQRGATWYDYEAANHAFDNPNPVFHHAEASELAWRRTISFLAEQLPT